MKPEIVFNVRNQSISRTYTFRPVQNSRNYLYAQFNFLTNDWAKAGTKTALFKGNGMESIAVIIGEDGKCLVPWEVLEKDSFTVSVFAGDLITSDTVAIKVYPSGYESGRDVKDPTPSVYEQIIDSFDDVKKYTTDQAKISTDSANFAKQSKESAEMAKESAETAAKSAEKSANEARDVKDSALKEISQSKSDSLESIESIGNSGVQAVNTAKSDAMTDIVNSSNTYLQSISLSGQSAVSEITSAGEDQTKSVNDAGKSQMDTIAALGDSQVKAVNTAGENQLSSIQTASAAALSDIATAKEESVSAVQSEGETQIENVRQSAEDYESLAIKETVHGESILIEDSAKWPMKGLKLFGKSTQDGTPSPENPIPIVNAGDSGQIEVVVYGGNLFNQGADKRNAFLTDGEIIGIPPTFNPSSATYTYIKCAYLLKGHTYVVSYLTQGNSMSKNFRYAVITDKNLNVLENGILTWKPYGDIVITPSVGGYLTASFDMSSDKIVINEGNIAFDWSPYKPKQSLAYPTPNGLPGIPVSSGGNYTDESGKQWVCDEVDFGRGVYVKRIEKVSTSNFSINFETTDSPGRFITRSVFPAGRYKNGSFESISNFGKWSRWGNVSNGQNTVWIFAVSGTGFYVRPPEGSGYSVDSLNEYLQSIVSEQNPIVFIAQLSEIEEIPLEESILSAYAALHTNYPTTTVMNDSDAGMEVGYVADTKNYINKLLGSIGQSVDVMADNEGYKADNVTGDETGNEAE